MTSQFDPVSEIEIPYECLQSNFIPSTIPSTSEILPRLKVPSSNI